MSKKISLRRINAIANVLGRGVNRTQMERIRAAQASKDAAWLKAEIKRIAGEVWPTNSDELFN
jgi:Trm5-related predicted tRNA methylase